MPGPSYLILKGRATERERDRNLPFAGSVPYMLATVQVWGRLKPRARTPSGPLMWVAGAVAAASQGALAGNCIRSGAAGPVAKHCRVRYRHPKEVAGARLDGKEPGLFLGLRKAADAQRHTEATEGEVTRVAGPKPARALLIPLRSTKLTQRSEKICTCYLYSNPSYKERSTSLPQMVSVVHSCKRQD